MLTVPIVPAVLISVPSPDECDQHSPIVRIVPSLVRDVFILSSRLP